MATLISTITIVWSLAAVFFVIFGPMVVAEKRDVKLDSGYVFLLTILSIPTVIGWGAVLAYSLLGETKET
tara:strand:- start:593 stop:802 length:210 start_codon:yes stop_codon:yes gene_type:complete